MKPLVLLTNDDGHHAAGLQAVRAGLRERFRVVTVAPATEMSGVSHAITLGRPLTIEALGDDVHAVDGTPADCVNIALHHVLAGERPVAVLSGVNHGANLGDDVFYSGTVGAAREAAILGLPAVALSRARGGPRSEHGHAAALAAALASVLAAGPVLPPGTFLNVNLPDHAPRGASLTRLARRIYRDPIREEQQPDGRQFLWVGGRPEWDSAPGTDHHAVFVLGHASLTLVSTDATWPGDSGRLEGLRVAAAAAAVAVEAPQGSGA